MQFLPKESYICAGNDILGCTDTVITIMGATSMPSSGLAALRALSELDFTVLRVKPLLEALNYYGVYYVGGGNPPERGRDLVFYEFDEKLLQRRDMAAQVKKGNITSSLASELLSQIDEAFYHGYSDPETGEPIRICRLFIVASGRITNPVIERIKVERRQFFPLITFWNGQKIIQLEKKIASSTDRVSRAEKLIHTLGLDRLFDKESFILTVSDQVEKMFEEMNLSVLMVTATLQEFLLSLDEVKSKIEILGVADQKEVLLCLSVMIVAKSSSNYAAEGKYGIQRPKRIRA